MKPRFLPKFPIWVQDWLSSSRIMAMTAAQEGAYLRLCLLQWQDGSLSDSPATLLRLGRLSGTPQEHALLLEAFPLCADGYRRNPKVAEVRSQSEAFCNERSASGRKGNATRWKSDRSAIAKGSLPSSDLRVPISESEAPSTEKPSPPAPAPSRPRKAPTGPQADRMRHWEAEWARTRLGQTWTWQTKDAVAMAKAVKLAGQDPLEVDRRATRLLEDPDPWRAREASPSILLSRWNQLAVTVTKNGGDDFLRKMLETSNTGQAQ